MRILSLTGRPLTKKYWTVLSGRPASGSEASPSNRASPSAAATSINPSTIFRPKIWNTRSRRVATGGQATISRVPCTSVKRTPGEASAAWVMYLVTGPSSDWPERRNFRRAGRLKNRSRTSTLVPRGKAMSVTETRRSPSRSIIVPRSATPSEVRSVSRDTAAMLARASPRKPSVAMCSRSSSRAILLVECRRKQSAASSRSMPAPSSRTLIRALPPSTRSTRISEAPASREFSTSSLTTETGLSTTSPAAIFWATSSGNKWIFFMRRPRPPFCAAKPFGSRRGRVRLPPRDRSGRPPARRCPS